MMKKWMALTAAAAVTSLSASAAIIFEDDFESYAATDPAVMTPNWVWNGNGTAPNASRIFYTANNFGGTQLWIAEAADANAGSGITSTATISMEAGQEYRFSGAVVTESDDRLRTAQFTVDLLVDGVSLIGGPQQYTARGDYDKTLGAGSAGDNTYDEQRTEFDFTSTTAGNLEIRIAFVSADASNPFVGIDEISISSIPEPATMGLFAIFGGTVLFVRRHRLQM